MPLSIGSVGTEVKLLQASLNALPPGRLPRLKLDGHFDEATKARVIEFQKQKDLSPNGIVADATEAAIQSAIDSIRGRIQSSPDSRYARKSAVQYAEELWDKVSTDGRVATKSGFPHQINGVTLSAGLSFKAIGTIGDEEDCTHFISGCIGTHSATIDKGGTKLTLRGGGLDISQAYPHSPVYGQTYAPALVEELLKRKFAKVVPPQFIPTDDSSTKASITGNLSAGDLVAYATKPNPDTYQHICLLVGPAKVSCHTHMRFGESFDDVKHPWITMIKIM